MSNQGDYSAGAMAFVGDAVFTLFVREKLTREHDFKTSKLTSETAKIVNAKTQAFIADNITNELSDDEKEIQKRCRNAHTPSRAKNASPIEYHKATGLEGLIGWLYLNNQAQRLSELLNKLYEIGIEK